MRIVMFTNFADPQIIPFCRTLDVRTDHQFTLAVTDPFSEELRQSGVPDYNNLPFVRKLYQSEDAPEHLISESDVIICAHCPLEHLNLSVKSGKPVFRFSQHIYRDGNLRSISLKRKTSVYLKHTLGMKNKPVYLMCLGTYTAQDYSLTGSYTGKMFEFGEFPELIPYSEAELMKQKEEGPLRIVWANEFSDICHPEICLDLARNLNDPNCSIEMIGSGERFEEIRDAIQKEQLPIQLTPAVSDRELNEKLSHASIFLMTSDYREGWGNILNRAMNHACASVVSTAVGSSKLIDQYKNGILYEYGSSESLLEKVQYLLQNPKMMRSFGMNAFRSLYEKWNGELAGNRFYDTAVALLNNKPVPYQEGLCSPAKTVTQEMMKEAANQPIPSAD